MAIKELRFLLKHSSVYGLGTIFAQAAGFLLLPFYMNFLTPADYGVAAIVETSITIIGIMVSMDLNQAIARFYAEGRDEKEKGLIISTSYVINALLCVIFIPILLLFSVPLSELLFGRNDYGKYFMISSTALFIGFFVSIGFSYLILRAKSSTFVFLSILNTIMLIMLNIYFIAFRHTGLIGIFYSALITKTFLAVVISAPILIKTGLGFSSRLGIAMVRFSMPLGFSSIFRVLTNESDRFFINYFFSPFETGIYAVAGKIAMGVHILLTSTFLQSFQPIRYVIAKEEGGPRTYGSIFEQYLLAIGAFGLFISIFSDEIIRFMAADEFRPSARYIPPLILSWILFGMKYHLENGILISMKSRYIFYISAASSVTNIVLNLILIPRWGLWGAVASSNVSNALLAGVSFVMSQRLYRIDIEWGRIAKLVLSVSICYFLAILATQLQLLISLSVKIALMAAFCWSAFAMGLIEPEIFLPIKRRMFPSSEEQPLEPLTEPEKRAGRPRGKGRKQSAGSQSGL